MGRNRSAPAPDLAHFPLLDLLERKRKTRNEHERTTTMVSAKATTTTAVKVALLAAVFVLCLAGFGSCQNSGFECTDAYVANTDICEAVCEPGEFLDPIIDPASEYQNGFGYFGYATFAEFVDAYAGYCDDTTLFDEAAPFQTTEECIEYVEYYVEADAEPSCSPCDAGFTSPGGQATSCVGDPSSTAPTCSTFDCPVSGFASKDPGTVCAGEECTFLECCIPQCGSYTCSPGFLADPTKAEVNCVADGCTDAQCCIEEQVTCPPGPNGEIAVVNDNGAREEIVCPPGQFVDAGAAVFDLDGSACSPCPAGTFQPRDESTAQVCDSCPPGETTDGEGSSTCVPDVQNPTCATYDRPCTLEPFFESKDPGTVCAGAECTFLECCNPQCGSYTCSPGFVEEASKQNELCDTGSCTDAQCCVPEQVTCPPGSFVDGNGCSECPEGFTSEGGTATECTPNVIKGCTDKDAMNFKSDATEDDGTCIFLHVAKAGGGSKVYGKGPHSQVTSGNGAFALKNKRSGTDLSISNSATWASSGLFGEAAGDSGAEAMTGVPQTSVAKSYSDAIMTNFDYNPVGKANSFFSGQGTSKRSPIEIASGADVSIVTPHFAGSSSGIFAGVSKSDPSLQGTYADVLSRGGGALKYTAIDVGRPSFDHLHG